MDDKKSVVTDPRGYTVSLSYKRYEEHIVAESGHIDVPIGDIMNTVEDPLVIYESSRPRRDVYFGGHSTIHPKCFVKVAVEINNKEKSGEVVTSFLTKKIGGGINETKGPKYVGFSNKL